MKSEFPDFYAEEAMIRPDLLFLSEWQAEYFAHGGKPLNAIEEQLHKMWRALGGKPLERFRLQWEHSWRSFKIGLTIEPARPCGCRRILVYLPFMRFALNFAKMVS